MIHCVLFDLSEVLIAGLMGIDRPIAEKLSLPADGLMARFGGERLARLCLGEMTEDRYLGEILAENAWPLSTAYLKDVIRENFHRRYEGSLSILDRVSRTVRVALHSDHAREWIASLSEVHPFLRRFERRFYSYELGAIKTQPESFRAVLEALSLPPEDVLFVDDSPANVATARGVGLDAIRFEGAEALREQLLGRGIAV